MSENDRTQSLVAQQRELVRNPFTNEVPTKVTPNGLMGAEQQRAIAEVQARMIIARSAPRDAIRAMDLILQDCTRKSLAEDAVYQYSRGGSSISGPSIRLIEAIALRWGNISAGIKEISRAGGYSECVAYAWDLESGVYEERQFQIRHWRDTRQGGHALTDERDIYELIANFGQRRKRAALQTVIPRDVVDAAVEQCEETMRTTADTSPEALKKVADAFAAYGVTKAQIEKRCQCRLEAIRPAQVVQLRRIFTSLKDGMSSPEDWFVSHAETELEATKAALSDKKTEPAKRTTTKTEPTEASHAPDPPRESDRPSDITGSTSAASSDFDYFALDPFGDPIPTKDGDLRYTRADHFAIWYNQQWLQTPENLRDALREQNADALADARKDPVARTAIAATEEPSGPTPIPLAYMPNGRQLAWAKYAIDYERGLKDLHTDAEIDAWVALQEPTYNGSDVSRPKATAAYEVKFANLVKARREELKPAEAKVDHDARRAADLVAEVNAATQLHALEEIRERITTRRLYNTKREDILEAVNEAFRQAYRRLEPSTASTLPPSDEPPWEEYGIPSEEPPQ